MDVLAHSFVRVAVRFVLAERFACGLILKLEGEGFPRNGREQH
jgi:hypothetical protein